MLKKIIFMGTPYFAVPILKSLYQNGYNISAVYTQQPQRSNRGQKINKSPIQGFSETLNIEFRTPSSLKNNKEEYDFLKKLNPDIAIVVAYGQIIPKEILGLVKKGFINIHASLLPKWRGAAPIQRSIMNLDKETGISIMKINEKLDSGPVCCSYKIEINDSDNATTLSNKLSSLAADKILDVVDDIMDDKIKFQEQVHLNATYANKIDKIEGKIDWNNSAKKIVGIINGLYPNPGAWFNFKGERYKILSAKISQKKGEVGEVLSETLEVACIDASIMILEIQKQGKQALKASEFMLGSKIKKGSNLQNE
tara:strand:- start:534 stop:1463 length:930 start_codon:yes stop_codon:yes gene_type:complete